MLIRHSLLRSRYHTTRRGKSFKRDYTNCIPRVEKISSLNLWTEVNRPFQVDRGRLVRVFVTRDRLVVIISHIIADYTTLSILLQEASALYNGYGLYSTPKLYSDTTVWIETAPPCYLKFWADYLQEYSQRDPPLLGRRQKRSGYQGTSAVSLVPEDIFRSLRHYSAAANVSFQQLATAAVALCLTLDTADTNILIGNPYINRASADDFETIGLFLEPLPVKVKFDPETSPPSSPSPSTTGKAAQMPGAIQQDPSYMTAVQRSAQSALAHALPWSRILEFLSITPDYPDHPLFDVMVTFHNNSSTSGLHFSSNPAGSRANTENDPVKPAEQEFEPCFVWSEGAKFKLMVEFTIASEDKLLMRIEYDSECVWPEELRWLRKVVPEAFRLLSQEHDFAEIKELLRDVRDEAMRKNGESESEVTADTARFFGMLLRDI